MPLVTLASAFLLGLMLVPLARRLSFRLGRVAQPREDRWHSRPTAKLGGIGIFLAFAAGLLISLLTGVDWLQERWGVLVGAALMFMLGLYDDFRPMSPQAKLGGQILAATVVIGLGYTTAFFSPRLANPILAQIPNILLTYFWLIGITNAINLLDNMDGLAAGISLITAGFLAYFFWRSGDEGSLAIALALVGGALSFLVFNFPPASIFMGDSGSLFLGFTLAVLAIARQPQASNVFAVMGVPTLLFLLPILDTALVTFTRLLRGQSPTRGGRDHTSHRLIAFGLSERQAVLALYGVALLSGVMAATLESIQYWFSLVLVPLLVLSLTLLVSYLGGLKVAPAGVPPAQDKPITRIMLDLTFKRRLLEVILDFFLIGIAYYLAFLANFGGAMVESHLVNYQQSLPVALAGTYLSFFALGVYRGVWRYVDFNDLVRYFQACLGGVILTAALSFLLEAVGLAPWEAGHSLAERSSVSPMIFLFFAVFLFLGLAASRSSFRILGLVASQRVAPREAGVLIYGAGDAGEMALRWILMNPQLQYRPVGFLDDDPFMSGRQIHGVEVLGGPEDLESILERRQVDGLILAGGDHSTEAWRRLVEICQQHGCWVRRLRLEFEPLE